MARILSSLIGDLRGSIGGQTYSRNKAGAFIRQRVKPVNPQTVIQQQARFRFGNMSILYQSLSPEVKGCWQNFASTHFNPLKGNNTGIYSGGNAFVGLRQSAGQGNQMRVNPLGTQDGDPVAFTTGAYLETTEPPAKAFGATIQDSGGIIREVQVIPLSLNSSGALDIELSIPTGSTSPTNTIDQFTDAEGVKWGLSAYVSNPLKFEGAKPNTMLKANLWDTGLINGIILDGGSTGFTVDEPVIMQLSSPVDAEDQKNPLCVGDVVRVTVFGRSEYGAQKLINSRYITVQ